ncbi:hypothetical protein ACJMK2_010998 [Sinanodonta woodiana]|uniref:LIM zinc-binding domain-containing protein n=1 Tax=Sinanodonta woodiana TaxID=1069815 RepID=A0ABD3V3G1_SINWO
MESDPDLQIQVHEEKGQDGTYKYSFSYERATLYEFKYERNPAPDSVDPCYRCYRRVYPKEQVNVGILFHKQCFRCRICGLPLTMQTFYRNDANGTYDKEVYCRTHVGKQINQIQYEKTVVPALELTPQGPSHSASVMVEAKSRKGLGSVQGGSPKPSPRGSPRSSPRPESRSDLHNTTGSSMTFVTPRSKTHPSMGTWNSSSLDYSLLSGGAYSRPRYVLQSFEDFERSGVFEAQSFLEQRHCEEDARLQRFLSEEREREMKKIDDSINSEKERAAVELLAGMDQLSLQQNTRNLAMERDRLEEHFRRCRDDKMKMVMDKVGFEEKARSGKMMERHAQEMLMLIAEKDREVDGNALYDHSMRPAIIPPETKKAQLFKSPVIFEHIDKRAIELSNRDYTSYTDLIRDLTKECKNELEKARALFRWVIAKDLGKNSVNEIVRPNSSVALLKGVKSGKETYHQLFKKLCSYAGLHCEIIMGYSKGAGYKPGMNMDGNTFRNSWTAVAIDGSWRLINCTWAARQVTGHKDNLPQIFHKYDEFYFLTDPEDYVYQHYPDESAWQLLEIPLPFSEFLNLPVVKSPFFNYGLKFYSNYGATLSTDTGMVEVRLVTPKILGFGNMLEPYNKSIDTRVLEGRVLLRLVKNEAIFTINLPQPGLYNFSIYTGDFCNSDCLESACSFLINCRQLMGPPSPPYPPVSFFGPTPVMEKMEITAENQLDPLIVSDSDYLEIIFKMNKDIHVTHTFQYFESSNGEVQDIDRYVFLKSRNNTGAIYMIRCPKEGFYIFSLYASESSETTDMDCAYRYLVICQQPNPSVNAFPKTYHRWQRCTLHEPIYGDLMTNKRYTFRLEVPNAVEVFVVMGEYWYHLKRKLGFTWEGSIPTSKSATTLKIYARLNAERDCSIFAHLLDYELVEDAETEI